ncbi:MAG TPA: isoprenylcysteine carboxylmethyltransferase family protein [Pyrinomonadaceae bacterium]
MENEQLYRVALVALYLLFHALRGHFAQGVLRTGGKVFSKRDDDTHEGRLHSSAGLLMEIILPLSVIVYAVYPAWVARLALPFPQLVRLLGVGLCLVSLVQLVRVHRALGRHWSASLRLRDDHRLVTEGPYRRVRHPMYTALIGNMLGLCLMSANLLIIVPRLVQIFLLLLRMGKEESMMLSRFGEEYRSYMARSGRLFPPPHAR